MAQKRVRFWDSIGPIFWAKKRSHFVASYDMVEISNRVWYQNVIKKWLPEARYRVQLAFLYEVQETTYLSF